jgi:uncharacterized protein (DUF849 family)
MNDLPRIMVAPNGARRTKSDHPALPMTVGEIARTAAACLEAGAGAIHAHVRDAEGQHVLDAGLYREATEAVHRATEGRMLFQMTTEAVGRYSPAEQQAVVRAVEPAAVSIALKEMIPDGENEKQAGMFYAWAHEAGIAVQHILYEPHEVARFAALAETGVIPGGHHAVLFPLGRYTNGQESDPAALIPFLEVLDSTGLRSATDWAVCAFGVGETRSLAATLALGGKVRVGFENSLWHADGSVAKDNAERVVRIAAIARALSLGS